LDFRPADVKEKERLKRREERIEDMLADKSLDYRTLIKELDYEVVLLCDCPAVYVVLCQISRRVNPAAFES
jgi:hypothetical protein